IKYVKDLDIPIVGINTGRLGFLATVNKEEIRNTIDKLLRKEYHLSERSLLCIETEPSDNGFGDKSFALNEVDVNRKNTTSMITPSTTALAITPIAPHSLNARPLIIKDNTRITLKVSGRENEYPVSLDARIAPLQNNTIINIKKAPFKIKMVEFRGDSFLKTL